MYIKIKIPSAKKKGKCSNKCRFLTESVISDWCSLFDEVVRRGTNFKNRVRCDQCLEAELKIIDK